MGPSLDPTIKAEGTGGQKLSRQGPASRGKSSGWVENPSLQASIRYSKDEEGLSAGFSHEPGYADCGAAKLCPAAGIASHAWGPNGIGTPGGHQKA